MDIDSPHRGRSAPPRFALWQLGFRPFFLLASIFAALSIALWAAQYAGWLSTSYLPGPVWHAHEMLFGFTLAVITGFLFTAVRNWASRATPTGVWLMAIAALWVCGRVLLLTPLAWLSALVNAAFPLAVAIGIGIPLVKARNRRNYVFVAFLVLIAAAVLCVHLTYILGWPTPAWIGIQLALDLVLLIMTIMAGRVIPMFTMGAIQGVNAQRYPVIERASLGVVVVVTLLDVIQIKGALLVVALVFAALIHGMRWSLWAPHKTLRTPLVWVLHAAYAWIPIHFALRVASELQLIVAPVSTHALTVGAIGGLTIGMMTRTAKGHTGRPLVANAADTVCYSLILAAAVVRVFGPLLLPAYYAACVLISAAAWSAGFGLYALWCWVPLTHARIDGKPG
ncbi:MAG: NnrS family protein [Betaproteobacteria bacterium]